MKSNNMQGRRTGPGLSESHTPHFPTLPQENASEARAPGRFVWHELFTPDGPRALAFYTDLFDWVATDPEGGELVRLVHPTGAEVAGLIQLEPDQDLAAQWVPAVAVDDVSAAGQRALALGGRVPAGEAELANGQRIGLVSDPQGALVAPIRAERVSLPAMDVPPGPPGGFSWHELVTPEPESIESFYKSLFGWQTSEIELDRLGPYGLFDNGSLAVAGVMPSADPAWPGFWLSYLEVENAGLVVRRAESLGGRSLQGPIELPEGSRYALLADPTGATIGVVEPKAAA